MEKVCKNDESKNPFLTKAKEAVWKIKYKNATGIGFFCDIPDMEDYLPSTLLITIYHVYPQDSSLTHKFIDITINGNNKRIYLERRGKWTNSNLDFTCMK